MFTSQCLLPTTSFINIPLTHPSHDVVATNVHHMKTRSKNGIFKPKAYATLVVDLNMLEHFS